MKHIQLLKRTEPFLFIELKMIGNNWYMSKQNQAIDSYIRRQRFRKVLVFVTAVVLFVGFMSYALYMEYGWFDSTHPSVW